MTMTSIDNTMSHTIGNNTMQVMSIVTVILAFFMDMASLQQLASEDFATRTDAANLLRKRGLDARPALLIGIGADDAETRSTCATLLGDACATEAALLEPVPEIDAAWYDAWPRWWAGNDSDYRESLWLDRYVNMVPYLDAVGRDDKPWPNYYTATQLWVRAEINAGARARDLEPLIIEMRARDAVFLARHGLTPQSARP